jgi:hypothetical protein
MTNPSKWKYYTEKGLRKRKLKLMTFTGLEARELYNAQEYKSTDLTSSFHETNKGEWVFEFFLEETLDDQ